MTDLPLYHCHAPYHTWREIIAVEPMSAAEQYAEFLPVGQYAVEVRTMPTMRKCGVFEVERYQQVETVTKTKVTEILQEVEL